MQGENDRKCFALPSFNLQVIITDAIERVFVFFLEEKGAANEMKDKKEVEMEDPVCITLEYYR